MDLTIDAEDYRLNIRATAIIIHNNKILVHNDKNFDHYALVGGRVILGENSAETIKRELLEETGKEIEITGYISTIENFFEANNKKYHEIMFVYQTEFKNSEDKKIETRIKNIEGEDHVTYDWISLDNLDKENLKPDIVKDIIKEKVFPVHKIYQDITYRKEENKK